MRGWILLALWFMVSPAWGGQPSPEVRPYFKPPVLTADHSKFEILKRDFKSPEEVTRACLSCHNKAGEQMAKTLHYTWTWKGKDGRLLGKSRVINNF